MSYLFGIKFRNRDYELIKTPILHIESEFVSEFYKFLDVVFEEYPDTFRIAHVLFVLVPNRECYSVQGMNLTVDRSSFYHEKIISVQDVPVMTSNDFTDNCCRYSVQECGGRAQVFNRKKCQPSIGNLSFA